MIKITVIAAGFANQGSKIITKERRDVDDMQREIELRADKEDEDRSIPAFLRRGKSTLPQKSSSRETPHQNPEGEQVPYGAGPEAEQARYGAGKFATGQVKKERPALSEARPEGRRPYQTSIHIVAGIASKPELRSLQKGYANISNLQPPRSNDLWDFNVERKKENSVRDAEKSSQENLKVNLRSLFKKIGEALFILFALAITGIAALAVGIYALIKFLKSCIIRMIRASSISLLATRSRQHVVAGTLVASLYKERVR